MYNNLLYGAKRRILKEVEDAFLNHPAFSEKVKVFNKFPYEERIQYGAVLRNSSAAQIRMSADNYMADLHSFLRLAKNANYPGIAIEWARENTNNITTSVTENLTPQVDPTQRLFFTTNKMVVGYGEPTYVTSPGQITFKINGLQVQVEAVDGKNKKILLPMAPSAGSTAEVTYWAKVISPPGIYVVDFIEDNQFTVSPIYSVDNKVLVNKTTGLETTISLGDGNIYPGSEEVVLEGSLNYSGVDSYILVRDTNYTIDNTTGIVTFLNPVPADSVMKTSYRWQPTDYVNGPYTFNYYQEVHTAIPGVVICMGRRAKKGDQQAIIISEDRESQAMIYGGHWDMSLSLGIISKDTIQMEEMVDQVVNYLWAVRKNIMEFEGFTLNRVEPTGESEETFIETTGDLYYESTVDISVMTEWQRFIPYLYTIRHINTNIIPLVPDMREVIKYPEVGYERVL
jgi:hypothetical protein